MRGPSCACAAAVAAWVAAAGAQVLELAVAGRDPGAGPRVGEVMEIQVRVDLQAQGAAGAAIYITVPEEIFEVVDADPAGRAGVQPFVPGGLFGAGLAARNALVPESDPVAGQLPGQQLEYAVVQSPGAGGAWVGAGEVARFALRCLEPAAAARVEVEVDPVRETRLVLADRRAETRFRSVKGLQVTVAPSPGTVAPAPSWGRLKGRHAAVAVLR